MSLFTQYHVEIQIRNKILGGVPKNPKVIEAWLITKMHLEEGSEELRQQLLQTMNEMGYEVRVDSSQEEIDAAVHELAKNKGNGFKRDSTGLYYEGRQMKAALRESVNTVFAGERRGPTRKGAKNFFVERVFVRTDWEIDPIYMRVDGASAALPTDMELFIGHVDGPLGTRATLTLYDYVYKPAMGFEVIVLKDEIGQDEWPQIWGHAGENGIGAVRSQGYGCFNLVSFDKVKEY